jgi:hypothetical protein|tara:strand:+ start:453 stop:1415 length:963 start_codon:yes stop_codon:yes gene_type:complete
MINAVRNTVLAILNKNNYGYISPADFNLFAKQAQLDIFDEYFLSYNSQINKENARVSGEGYADMVKNIEEVIDSFSVTASLSRSSLNTYIVPTSSTTGSDYYLLNKILIYKSVVTSGITSGTGGGNTALIDSSATFVTKGVAEGDVVSVIVSNNVVSNFVVLTVDSETQLTVNSATLTTTGLQYSIYKKADLKNEAEQVSHTKITMLNKSLLTTPNITFPAYTLEGNLLTLYPDTIQDTGRVVCQYIRYPKDPKWTYVSLTGGEPIFDQSQPDYQDFELPPDDVNNLVARILQYSGASIREVQAVQFGQVIEKQEQTEDQ